GAVGFWGPVSYYLGMTALTMGESGLAISHFEKAIEENGQLGSPLWTAWAELESGALLAKRNSAVDRARGADLVRKAFTTARDFGFANLEKRAKATMRDLR